MKLTTTLLLAFMAAAVGRPAAAQTPDSSSGAPASQVSDKEKASTTAPGADKKPDAGKKPKRVWTNDDVGSLKGSVSVVGGKTKTPAAAEADEDASNDPHAARVQQYRAAIEQCHSQIAQADARIAQLKDFKGQNTTASGGINPNGKYNMVPPEEQVKQLEARKKELEAKIEDLENQARKEGIDPGELR